MSTCVPVALSVAQSLGAKKGAGSALAVALCHLHTAQTAARLPSGVRLR